MRHISADYIFTITSEPIKNGVITVDDTGTIIDISSISSQNQKIEYYKGIICPGFINTHCHIELSHLRSKISERTGMSGFIKEFLLQRGIFSDIEIQNAIIEAEAEMIKNGIVAVGDISNNEHSFKQKAKGNLLYHTFIEIFDLDPTKAEEVFENAKKLECELQQILNPQSLIFNSSITPHAPYSVSKKLFQLIHDEAVEKNSIISIHNQESEGENELFITGSGIMADTFKAMGINTDTMRTGMNSLRYTLSLLPKESRTLLVHNTYTSLEDIQISNLKSQIPDLFWCTCPNANLYIENKLPNYQYFFDENARITIGTDSLASNWSLSVLDELKTITKHFPQISLQILLLWSTKNGADFLGFDHLGTIEKGKRPGLNLLKNVDGLKISEKTEVVKLI
ncbi:MAG: amidohydrolase family protein [Bacteroidota bacterium]